MTPQDAIRDAISTGEFICLGYLQDLTDAELLHRPAPGANHILWQLGHLIASEHRMLEIVKPGSMPALPSGFADRYKKETAGSDNPADFDSRETLMQTFRAQRDGTLRVLSQITAEDLDRPSGVSYAATVCALLNMQSVHWLMHAGQWAVTRRQLGRPPLF
jgi:hypothetical protein